MTDSTERARPGSGSVVDQRFAGAIRRQVETIHAVMYFPEDSSQATSAAGVVVSR